jgi:antitoxin (DNA-binding transcriptional repressor) of toxin-antitoxin stability system
VSELNRQTAKVLDRIKAGESLEISACGANPFMYVKST